VAALTRASIRPRHAAAFWRHAPPSEAALAQAAGCRLAVGLGEAPLLRQATFSLWDNAAAMDAYARSGAHQAAIRAAHGGGYFSESMFVRYRVLGIEGHWPAPGGGAR
jgi:spheroidene monooxygenase